jgi:hypothetical protein
VSSDSPVASSVAQRLVLMVLAEKQWIPNSWDFATVFLQGKILTPDVIVVPPIEFVGSHVVWRLKKHIYGIVSAPKSWFDRLVEVCRASGLTTATTDEGLLIMTSGEQVVGVLVLHVDDAIGGDTEEFHSMMAKIGDTLAVGSHETSNFRYKGLRVSTVFKDEQSVFEINIDGDDYSASCRTMDVPLGEDTDFAAAAVYDRISFGRRDHWLCIVRIPPGPGAGNVVFVSSVCDTDHLWREASNIGSPVRLK